MNDCETQAKAKVPPDGQSVADDSLTAASVLDVYSDGCRVRHVSETTLVETQTRKEELYLKNKGNLRSFFNNFLI